MEERKIILEPVIWWSIDAKNEVSKYDSPESISRITYWIKQTDIGERYTTMYGNTYEIYQYEIFDINLTNVMLIVN